jgi:hypothetical protein
MAKTYDSKCLELAQHFGTGDPDEQLSEHEIDELASDLQDVVETYFQFRRNKAEAAYDRAQEEPTFRGSEYASALAEEQARIQRELKR